MKLKDEKVTGYVLLVIGVAMIFFSVFSLFNVFSGASNPPKLFNFSDISLPIPQPAGSPQSMQILTAEEMNKMSAMAFWYLLMFFIMMAGGRIASLGVNLIREIKVEVKK